MEFINKKIKKLFFISSLFLGCISPVNSETVDSKYVRQILNVVRCSNYETLEKDLHKKFKENRIPQTEYFRLENNQIEEVNIEMINGANF